MQIVYDLRAIDFDYDEQYIQAGCTGEVFTIGYFSSRETCEQLIKEYRLYPGFCKDTCTFHIYEYELDTDVLPETLYGLYQEYDSEDDYCITVRYGIFLTQEEAQAIIDEVLSGSDLEDDAARAHADAFEIYEIQIGLKAWQYGFDRA